MIEDKLKSGMWYIISHHMDTAQNLYARVQRLLDADHEYMQVGGAGDLFPFSEIDFTDTATHPVGRGHLVEAYPSCVREFIARCGADSATGLPAATSSIKRRLDQKLAGVAQFMKADRERGLVVAGGGVSAYIIHGRPGLGDHLNDMDFFAVGYETDAEIAGLVNAFAAAFAEWTGERVHVVRTLRYLTFKSVREIPFQIILKLYTSISEILHSFDIAACAVAYDGRELWTTALGAFAYTTGVIPINLVNRRESFEHRLVKYHRRGFTIYLQDMRPPGRTPASLAQKRLRVGKIIMYTNDVTSLAPEITSEYEATELLRGEYAGEAPHANNVCALRTENLNALKAFATYTPGMDVTAIPIVLDERSLLPVFTKALGTGYGFGHGKIRTPLVKALLGDDEAGELIRRATEEHLSAPDTYRYVRATLERYAGVCPGILPFKCTSLTHGPADPGPPTDLRDWYGDHYDDPVAADAVAAGVMAACTAAPGAAEAAAI